MSPAKILFRIESSRKGFLFWIVVFFAIIFLRLVCESLLESTKNISSLQLLLSNSLFFVVSILGFALVLSFFAKERISKATKTVIVFSPVILVVPFIDFFASGGAGYQLSYIAGNTNCILQQLFLFYPNTCQLGFATPGQKIELAVSLALAFAYCWIKRKKILNAFSAAIALHVFIWFLAILPTMLFWIFSAFNFFGIPFASDFIQSGFGRIIDIIFLLLAILESLFWFLLWKKKKFFRKARSL